MYDKKREIKICPTCANRFQAPCSTVTEICYTCRAMKAAGIKRRVRCVPEYRELWNGMGEHAQYCPLG